MPPFEVENQLGAFELTRVVTGAGGVVRVQRVADETDSASSGRLELVWILSSDERSRLAGRIAVLSFSARGYAPPDGLRVYISDEADEGTSSSSVRIEDIAWRDYVLEREIPANASEIRIGLDWAPVLEYAWYEIGPLRLTTQDPATYDGPLAPTDIPYTPTATLTPTLAVVTSTPTPQTVFEAATRVAMATANAASTGTATPTSERMVTATPTATPTETTPPIIVTNTPTPGNKETATMVALEASASAFTTGTPTPYPSNAIVLVATPTSTPAPRNTPTPLFVLLEDLPPTNTPTATPFFPVELTGKIAFKANLLGNDRRPDYMIMNPDGTGLARLTSGYYYQRAAERDHYSGDRRFYASVSREQDGFRRIQIFYDFIEFGTKRQLTFFGAGTAWDPAWSPINDTVVLVSNESRNDELWLVQRDEWPAIKLTNNEWEWDNHPSFSPDGSQIVFMSNRITGRRQLWIMDANGVNQHQLTDLPFEAWDPVWIKYPDG